MSCLLGQAQEQGMEFETASVRPAKPLTQNPERATRAPSRQATPMLNSKRVVYRSVSLAVLIRDAFGVQEMQIQGPGWISTELYDLEAKVADDAPAGQVPAMLRKLLADRFRLVAHFATTSDAGYALVVSKGGAKLAETPAAESRVTRRETRLDGLYTWKATTMEQFATSLWPHLHRPVIDATSLSGVYDIQLYADPVTMGGASSDVRSEYPSVFVAINEVGLELEPRAIPIKHLVIDSALKVPVAN